MKKKQETEERPYVLCTLGGYDRVPDTKVLLKADDYKLMMVYLDKAVAKNPEADIMIDPDDCGECYIELEEFMKYNISAKPIHAETYEDICQEYEREHFGFNYVLDAVLDAVYSVIGSSLTPTEIKWFTLRSPSVSWIVKEASKNKSQSEKLDRQAAYLAANSIRNCITEVCHQLSENIIDMKSLRENVNNIVEYVEELELTLK